MHAKAFAIAASLVLLAACDDKKDTPPTAAEKNAALSAEANKDKAQAEKNAADKAVADAKKKADEADKKLDHAKDEAKAAVDKLGDDWKGPDHDPWNRSWTGFYESKEKNVDVGDWTIERGESGVYTAWRKVKDSAAAAKEKVADATVLTAVKAKLALDEDVKSSKIDVDVKDNVVHLKGAVDKPEQAGEAMRVALGTPGVDKVVSNLTWAPPAKK